MADEDEKAPDTGGGEAESPIGRPTPILGSLSSPPGEPPPVRTTSATPPPLDSDPFAITGLDDPPPKPIGAISSGAFEISRASFSQPPPEDLPPSTVIANAMGRNQAGLSLGAIAGIGAAVLVVAIGLALLLFR